MKFWLKEIIPREAKFKKYLNLSTHLNMLPQKLAVSVAKSMHVHIYRQSLSRLLGSNAFAFD